MLATVLGTRAGTRRREFNVNYEQRISWAGASYIEQLSLLS